MIAPRLFCGISPFAWRETGASGRGEGWKPARTGARDSAASQHDMKILAPALSRFGCRARRRRPAGVRRSKSACRAGRTTPGSPWRDRLVSDHANLEPDDLDAVVFYERMLGPDRS
jgi:hypothetical protein